MSLTIGQPLAVYQTQDTNLAAALWTLGARFINDPDGNLLVRLSKDNAGQKHRTPFWTFQPDQHLAHPYPAPSLVDISNFWARWNDAEYQTKHWLDPWCYMRRAFDARAALVSKIAAAELFDPPTTQWPFKTSNTKMAATLCAFGAQFPIVVKYAGDTRALFFFRQEQLRTGYPAGTFATSSDVFALYAHPAYHKENPDSPLAHCKFGLENRERLIDAAVKKLPLCAIRKGGRQWLVKPRQAEDGRLFVKLPTL